MVEDDAQLRDVMAVVLRTEGYEVAGAEDGQSALDRLREQLPDVIVLDMGMPGMDGLSFLATKARIPAVAAIPVVVVSGSAPRDAPRGVVAWLEKPCLFDALLRVLRPWSGAAPRLSP